MKTLYKVCLILIFNISTISKAYAQAIDVIMPNVAVQTFDVNRGLEFPGAQGSLQIFGAANSDSTQALYFDFTGGGSYVASVMTPVTPIAATSIHFRLQAPIENRIVLNIVDQSGQTLQFYVDRSTAVIDDMGWSSHAINISSSSIHWSGLNNGILNGAISEVRLQILQSPLQKSGVAYFRDIQFLQAAPSLNMPALPSSLVQFKKLNFYNGAEFPGARGSLAVIPPTNGDSIQQLNFDFSAGGNYVASQVLPLNSLNGSYVRFRVKGALQNSLALNVLDDSGQTLQFWVNRQTAMTDAMGWSVVTIPVMSSAAHWGGANDGILRGGIKQLSFAINKNAASMVGSVYFKQLEILDHAPSAFYSPIPLTVTPFQALSFYNGAEFPGATGSLQQIPGGNGDTTQILNYDFSGGGNYVAATMQLLTPATANMARLMIKAPAGVEMSLRFIDQTNQTFSIPILKPLSTLNDSGWVQHAVTLTAKSRFWGGANDGIIHQPIGSIALIVNNSTNDYSVTAIKKSGSVMIKQIKLYNESRSFDLMETSNTLPGARSKNSNTMQNMGIVIHWDDVRSFDIAQQSGFKRVRFDMSWAVVEKVKGVYDFSAYDNRIQLMLARGLVPQAILGYNNTLYSPDKHWGVDNQTNLNAYMEFAKQAALHYKGKNVTFELWNEANLVNNWLSQPDENQYANLVKQASAAIHSVASSAQLISGGLAFIDFKFLKGLISNSSLADVIGVGIHPYRAIGIEGQADTATAANQLLANNNVKARVFFTELGSSSTWYGASQSQAALDRQASMTIRNILVGWAVNTPQYDVYQLRDEVTAYDVLDPESNFGLIGLDYSEKPAKKAMDLLFSVAKTRGYQGLITAIPSSVQAMKFSATGKETVYVAWVNSERDSATMTVPNSCNPNLDFAGLSTLTANPCVVDMVGKAVACVNTGINGRMRCPVSEAGGPIFIRMK
jgi:hypothetical protein